MIVETSDGQKITANFPQPLVSCVCVLMYSYIGYAKLADLCLTTLYPQRDPLDPFVEVLGKVEQDCSITVERIANFGASFGTHFLLVI